jgi:hypothetical protein
MSAIKTLTLKKPLAKAHSKANCIHLWGESLNFLIISLVKILFSPCTKTMKYISMTATKVQKDQNSFTSDRDETD